MALQGKFLLNNADYSPLNIFGVGVFMAFSGNGAYRNRGGCGAIPNKGPIPPGRYWVVDRPEGGIRSKLKTGATDIYNHVFNGSIFKHNEWFALYRDDWNIDDHTWIESVQRGNFRLHPGSLSEGCITLSRDSDFALIRNALLRTQKVNIPCTKKLMAYAMIEVIASDKTCP